MICEMFFLLIVLKSVIVKYFGYYTFLLECRICMSGGFLIMPVCALYPPPIYTFRSVDILVEVAFRFFLRQNLTCCYDCKLTLVNACLLQHGYCNVQKTHLLFCTLHEVPTLAFRTLPEFLMASSLLRQIRFV